MTRKELVRRMGRTNVTSLGALETPQANPTWKTICRYLDGLGCDPQDLVEEVRRLSGEEEPVEPEEAEAPESSEDEESAKLIEMAEELLRIAREMKKRKDVQTGVAGADRLPPMEGGPTSSVPRSTRRRRRPGLR